MTGLLDLSMLRESMGDLKSLSQLKGYLENPLMKNECITDPFGSNFPMLR